MENTIKEFCFDVSFLTQKDKSNINHLMDLELTQDYSSLCARSEAINGFEEGAESLKYRDLEIIGYHRNSNRSLIARYSIDPSLANNTGIDAKICHEIEEGEERCVALSSQYAIVGVANILRKNIANEEDCCQEAPVKDPLESMAQSLWQFFVDTFSPKYGYPA